MQSTMQSNSLQQKKIRNAELTALGKTFGHIPNVPIFTHWKTRQDCINSAVHRSLMGGICGGGKVGAYSVVLSGSYKDDEDGGDVIIYTGSGGWDKWSNTSPPKRLRFGPQTKDQSWDNFHNKALITSFLSENPVRVIRSWKCTSRYAPVSGYRYDGLFKVAAYWMAKGHNGKKICRCRLERLPDQPPIPLRPITMTASSRRNRKCLISGPPPSISSSTSPYANPDGIGAEMRPNQSDVTRAQFTGSEGRESEGLSNLPQQREMSEPSAGVDFSMGESEPDTKHPQPSSSRVPLTPSSLPKYRWDPRKNELVKIPTSSAMQETFNTAQGDEEENRVEDDATLAPTEDGRVDMSVTERMETEYISDDIDNADEPHAL